LKEGKGELKKRVVILGSTGSMGKQVLDVINKERERFEVVGLAGKSNLELLQKQAEEFSVPVVALADEEKAEKLRKRLKRREVYGGKKGIIEVAKFTPADLLICCIVGKVGLIPIIEAIKSGKNVALANKESLVIAGNILKNEAIRKRVKLFSLDSEEIAIFQCLEGYDIKDVEKIYLTASGGPFWKWKGNFEDITPAQALSHPRWKMGPKISLDSATLINKGLEVIETHYFFGIEIEKIKIIIHPDSIVHSLVEFIDGSILCQMGITDMRLPIHYILNYPERRRAPLPFLKLDTIRKISFEPPDFQKFPGLRLAYWAGKEEGTLPAVFSAADEVAVEAFLKRKIKFSQIIPLIEEVMERHKVLSNPSLEEILNADEWARKEAYQLLERGYL